MNHSHSRAATTVTKNRSSWLLSLEPRRVYQNLQLVPERSKWFKEVNRKSQRNLSNLANRISLPSLLPSHPGDKSETERKKLLRKLPAIWKATWTRQRSTISKRKLIWPSIKAKTRGNTTKLRRIKVLLPRYQKRLENQLLWNPLRSLKTRRNQRRNPQFIRRKKQRKLQVSRVKYQSILQPSASNLIRSQKQSRLSKILPIPPKTHHSLKVCKKMQTRWRTKCSTPPNLVNPTRNSRTLSLSSMMESCKWPWVLTKFLCSTWLTWCMIPNKSWRNQVIQWRNKLQAKSSR